MTFTVEPLSDPDLPLLVGTSCWNLDELLNHLSQGTIGLWKVPPLTLEIWWAGRRSRNPEIGELQARLQEVNQEADALYERLCNPGLKLSDIRARRVQQALAEADAQGQLATEIDVLRIATSAAPRRRSA